MIHRIQHFLLIALFVAAQLIVHPLTATGWCTESAMLGAGCCCDDGEAAPLTLLSCCGEAGDSGERPVGPELDRSGCQCVASPPTPKMPERNSSFAVEPGGAAVAHEVDGNLAHLSVWPALITATERQLKWPPMLLREAEPAFRQVFRL